MILGTCYDLSLNKKMTRRAMALDDEDKHFKKVKIMTLYPVE